MDYFQLSDSCKLAYDYQNYGSKTAIVFLNGILMNTKSWEDLGNQISNEHPILFHDLRGQLKSGKVFPDDFSMQTHVQDLKGLLEELGIQKCHFIGTSYGGEVGLLFAHKYPDIVETITVIASVSYSDALLKHQVQHWKDLAGTSSGQLYDSVVAYSYSANFLEENVALLFKRKQGFSQLDTEFFKAFQRLCDSFTSYELGNNSLGEISAPALIIAAENDILKLPRYSKQIVKHIPRATYHEIPEAGHAVVVEKPKVLANLINDFLKNSAG